MFFLGHSAYLVKFIIYSIESEYLFLWCISSNFALELQNEKEIDDQRLNLSSQLTEADLQNLIRNGLFTIKKMLTLSSESLELIKSFELCHY